MIEKGVFEMGWTVVFQLMNTVLIIGIIYIVFYLIFMLPKQMKINAKKLEQMEVMLDKINEKLDKQ